MCLFLHQNVPKSSRAELLLLELENVEPFAEDQLEVRLLEEVVVATLVDDPVSRPHLTRIILEPGAEDRELKVALVLQQCRDMMAIGLPIRLLHVMKEAGV